MKISQQGTDELEQRVVRKRRTGWIGTGGLQQVVDAGDRTLAVTLLSTGNRWAALAADSPETSLGSVFENHRHAIIAEDVSLKEALTASDQYIRSWLERGEGIEEEDCDCEDIPEPPQEEELVVDYRLDDDVNTAAHFGRETLQDILEYVARRAKLEGWDLAKLQDEIASYYLTDGDEASGD